MHFFDKQKQKIEVKKFQSLFWLQTCFVQKNILYEKKLCMQILTFCVYNVVQDEFFAQETDYFYFSK